MKKKLVKETRKELHNELTRTLQEALEKKRRGELQVTDWVNSKKRQERRSRSQRKKKDEHRKSMEKIKAHNNDKIFSEWLKNSLRTLKREKSRKRIESKTKRMTKEDKQSKIQHQLE